MVKVTRDMTISDIIEENPVSAEIMQSYGLQCFGCSINTMESIEAGARGHGMSDEKITAMINEINSLEEPEKAKVEEQGSVEDLAVTDKAVEKMKAALKDQGKESWGIKVTVAKGGCAGNVYGMDFREKPDEGDNIMEFNGMKVFVDQKSATLLSGVTLDFVESLQESGFKFNNPNAKASCGCGKSFS